MVLQWTDEDEWRQRFISEEFYNILLDSNKDISW